MKKTNRRLPLSRETLHRLTDLTSEQAKNVVGGKAPCSYQASGCSDGATQPGAGTSCDSCP